jgi:hypothetical protein
MGSEMTKVSISCLCLLAMLPCVTNLFLTNSRLVPDWKSD